MAEIKYTQKMMFEAILAEVDRTDEIGGIPSAVFKEFAEKKLAQLDAKSSKTNSTKSTEHKAVMDMIIKVLCNADKQMKCGEIVKAVNTENGTEYSSSKINAMLRKMLPPDEKNPDGTGEVVRIVEKKDVFFALAD